MRADYPAVSFRDPVSEISGELVWLVPERLEEREGWPDYCCAARRKISIGEYHLECVRAQASHGHLEPTILVQAHLEGMLFAFVVAADQMAEAMSPAWCGLS